MTENATTLSPTVTKVLIELIDETIARVERNEKLAICDAATTVLAESIYFHRRTPTTVYSLACAYKALADAVTDDLLRDGRYEDVGARIDAEVACAADSPSSLRRAAHDMRTSWLYNFRTQQESTLHRDTLLGRVI